MEPMVVESGQQLKPDKRTMSLTPEIVDARVDRIETQQAEMRGALIQVQVALGKIDSLAENVTQFMARAEMSSERYEKSLIRLHERMDTSQKAMNEAMESMRAEMREMHNSHKDGVESQIDSAINAITGHLQVVDKRSEQTDKELTTHKANESHITEKLAELGKTLEVVAKRASETETGLGNWKAEIKGMARVAGWVWAVMGGGILGLGYFVLKLYFTQGG